MDLRSATWLGAATNLAEAQKLGLTFQRVDGNRHIWEWPFGMRKGEMMKRFGQIIRLQPGAREKYIEYHSQVWPEVLKTIHDCNIRNYSIFLKDDTLYAYFEYLGDNFEADMAKMAADPKTQEWWAIMEPMQQPVPTRKEGEWWANMEEVFHTD